MSLFSLTKTVMASLFRRPATLSAPLPPGPVFERTRGQIGIEIKLCIFCGLCDKRCPTGAIRVDKPASLWEIDRLDCIQCGRCVEVCPKSCLFMDNSLPKNSLDGNSKDTVVDLNHA